LNIWKLFPIHLTVLWAVDIVINNNIYNYKKMICFALIFKRIYIDIYNIRVYLVSRFYSVALYTSVCVCVWGGRNSSFFTPPEQYHRRSTRMKNVVNIVRSAAAAVQQYGGFPQFIISSARIELGFLWYHTAGAQRTPILDNIIFIRNSKIVSSHIIIIIIVIVMSTSNRYNKHT